LDSSPLARLEAATSFSRGGELPALHGSRPEGAEGSARDQVTLEIAGTVDGSMGHEEARGVSRRLEARQLALASSRRRVRDLGPVFLARPARDAVRPSPS
jgi:hypothetical protein